MSDWWDRWHTMTVTAVHFHPWPDCPGHDTADAEGAETEPEIEWELTHPDTCAKPDGPCCCKREHIDSAHINLTPGGTFQCACQACHPFTPCPACVEGRHDKCPEASWRYRCATEADLCETYGEDDLPQISGTYRVRASGWGPDHNGEYDGKLEWEPVPAGGAA